MAVPSSGAISLNDFHVEAGGSSGSQCTINDSDIRGLIGKSAGAAMSFNEWYGATGTLWETTITVGSSSNKNYAISGFSSGSGGESMGAGSISDNTIDFLSGSTCHGLYWRSIEFQGPFVYFDTNGGATNQTSHFTTMTIGSTSFATNQAYYFQSGIFKWQAQNPFPSDGNTVDVVFE